jgi:glycosyltransferase involved in cell wall biosynthesis
MMTDQPRIAVIVPAYRVAPYLRDALDSLVAQDFENWEAVVIDDGSPDDAAAIVAPYLADPRITFLATENRGVSAARNTAIAHSRAPLIALLDGDDRLAPNYLSTMVAALDANPAAAFATCNARFFGSGARVGKTVAEGRNMAPIGTIETVLDRSFNVYCGTTFRRTGFERVGGFDVEMRGSEDLDFWVRLLIDGGHAIYVDQVLGEYRVRPQSASVDRLLLLEGAHRVCTKARAALGNRPEAALAERLAAQLAAEIEFERGIWQVVNGEVRTGIRRLSASLPDRMSPIWRLALKVWAILPFLAPPMLRQRQRRHARFNTGA